MHYFGLLLQTSGSFLQQYGLSLKSKERRSASSSSNTYLIFSTGLFFEWISILLLPLSTYILLSSMHYMIFLYFDNQHRRHLPHVSEKIGATGMLLSYYFIAFYGGRQEEFSSKDLSESLDLYYFIWMLVSLAFNLTIRRLGFYANRALVESFIPAQIASIGLGGVKIIYSVFLVYLYEEILHWFLLIFAAGVAIATFSLASSFLKALSSKHEDYLVLGTFYLWNICYSIPLAIYVMHLGVFYTLGEYIVIFFAGSVIALAMLASVLRRFQHNNSSSKKQRNHLIINIKKV